MVQEAVLVSMVNGKVFREWVIPAVVDAYEQQVEGFESSYEMAIDIFSSGATEGLLLESIQKLKVLDITYEQAQEDWGHQTSCAICLQDFQDGDAVRRLPQCLHIFHGVCIDGWLSRRSSCPMCRKEIVI
ncbi:NEP1-interacting protein 1 [Nymphaea thermarum]|nr:NEP1-interacting protein 1 [Nymphaea thermarum]